MLRRFTFQTLPHFKPEGDGADPAAADPAVVDPAAPAADDPAAIDPAASAAGAADPAAAVAATPASDWRDKEIRRKHGQLQEERRRNKELEASLATANEMLRRVSGEAEPDPAATPARAPTARAAPASVANPADEDARVTQRAAQIVAQQNFEKASNDTDAAGRERYGADWQKATDTLATLGGFDIDTMNNILATDDPAQVLHALGSKPEEYQRLMDLPPARRFAEIVKLGLPAPKSVRKPSNAPAPVDPVRGANRGDPTALSDELDDDTWYARRAAQKKARFEQRRSGHA